MQLWGVSTGRAGKFAGGCLLLWAVCASTGASAQAIPIGPVAPGGLPAPGLGVGPLASTNSLPTVPDPRAFSITPVVGLQESFTDNALLTPTNKQYDFITRPMVGADVNLNDGPATAFVTGRLFYDAYAREGQLSGFSEDALGTGSYSLIPSFLSIDAAGVLTNTSASTFGTPTIDRVGTANRVQLATYDVGPHLTTTIDQFADLDLVGRFAQVFFSNPKGSTIGVPIDSTIEQVVGSLDTKDRFVGYESLTNGLYEKDDHGFEAYSGEQSFFVRVMPELRIIGRGGYDKVSQPGIVNLSTPLWSGGFELTINELSKITIERGERYDHTAWAGTVHLQFADDFYADGRYYETLQPNQLQISDSFVDFLAPATQIPIPSATPNIFSVTGNLDSQVSLNKLADLNLVYNWENQEITLEATWDDRFYLALNAHDRTLVSTVTYTRTIAPDLDFETRVAYWRAFANPFFGANDSVSGEVALGYTINPTMRLTGGYVYQSQEQLFVNGQTITENAAFVAITKSF